MPTPTKDLRALVGKQVMIEQGRRDLQGRFALGEVFRRAGEEVSPRIQTVGAGQETYFLRSERRAGP